MARKMKILCFHPALAPYRVDFFNLLADKADLKILFLQDNLFSQKFNQVALKKELKCEYGSLTRGFDIRNRCIRFGVIRAVKKMSPDVVLSYEASPVTLFLCLYKKFLCRRLKVWTFMDDSPDQVRSRTGLRRIIRDWVVRNVNCVIVPSKQSADEYVCQIHSKDTEFSVVPIIHDTDIIRKNAGSVYRIGEEWKKDNIPQSWEKVLLFVGRLAIVKNLSWLISQMELLSSEVGLVIVGDGELDSALKEQVVKQKLMDRVVFAGRQEGEKLYAIMSMADGLVLCSHSETFGAVVAEALQWGTPCVVAQHLGASVLIEDGVNGRVFPSGDEETFIKAIDNLPRRTGVSLLAVSLNDAVSSLCKQYIK